MNINLIKKHIFSIIVLLFSLLFLYKVKSILLPFILGFLIAYCFKDFVKRHEEKYSRGLLSIGIISIFSIVVVLTVIFVFPMIFTQLLDLIKTVLTRVENLDLNSFYAKFKEILVILRIEDTVELKQYFTSISSVLLKTIGNITNTFITSSVQVVNVVFMIFISPIVAFYLLRDWEKIVNFLSKECVPREFRRHFVILLKRIDDVLHHYIVGQIIVCLILGTFYSVLLFCIGFNYSFVVGLVAGFLTLLPYFGAFCGGGIALVLGYLQFGFSLSKLFAILFIFSLGQFLEGNFVTPNLIGNKIKVHPLWLIFGILAGGSLYGFWGIVVSMPLAAIIGVLVRFYFEEKNKKVKKYGIKHR